jgi:hypothetical protein
MVFSSTCFAQAKKELKDFLSESEFSIQREIIKTDVIGQKGLLVGADKGTNIKDVLSVDLIDPFENKAVSGTKVDLSHLDDGINFDHDEELAESISTFRTKLEDYFIRIEKQEDIDVVDLLNHIKINRIISSPIKYVVIKNKKYQENDTILVKFNRFVDNSEFNEILNSIKVKTNTAEESELLEQMKTDALKRYNDLTKNTETALNVIKITISEIDKHQVSFMVEGKLYKLVMQQ